MLIITCNVEKFNIHVNLLLDSLLAQGETTTDLLHYLFKAYEAVLDKEFVRYMKSKREKYEEGEDITAQKLMVLASNKYKLLVEWVEWNTPSNKEEKVLALQLKIAQLEQKKKTGSKKKKELKKTKVLDLVWLKNQIKPAKDIAKAQIHKGKP